MMMMMMMQAEAFTNWMVSNNAKLRERIFAYVHTYAADRFDHGAVGIDRFIKLQGETCHDSSSSIFKERRRKSLLQPLSVFVISIWALPTASIAIPTS